MGGSFGIGGGTLRGLLVVLSIEKGLPYFTLEGGFFGKEDGSSLQKKKLQETKKVKRTGRGEQEEAGRVVKKGLWSAGGDPYDIWVLIERLRRKQAWGFG